MEKSCHHLHFPCSRTRTRETVTKLPRKIYDSPLYPFTRSPKIWKFHTTFVPNAPDHLSVNTTTNALHLHRSVEARKMNRRTVWETETTQDQRTYSCRSDNRGQTTYEASRRGDLSRSVKNRPGKESEIGEIPRAIREGGLTD